MHVAKIIGWVLSGLIVALFLFSGVMKFVDFEGKAAALAEMKLNADVLRIIGAIEIACALLFVLPWTSFLGAILLVGYLGGAIMIHVQKGELPIFQVVIGVLVWVALGLRHPHVFQMAIGNWPTPPDELEKPKV